jgi:hypothetical protein
MTGKACSRHGGTRGGSTQILMHESKAVGNDMCRRQSLDSRKTTRILNVHKKSKDTYIANKGLSKENS